VHLSTYPVLDAALAALQANKETWAALGIGERHQMLGESLKILMRLADKWAAVSLAAKGVPARSLAEAEEWLFLGAVIRAMRTLRELLTAVQRNQSPITGSIQARPDGQVVVRAFPRHFWERLLFQGISGEVWLEPGVTVAEARDDQAHLYRDMEAGHSEEDRAKIALVLGAGNASMLPVIDTLHKLFVENQVVILKLNPVNAYLRPLLEEVFQPFISRGFLRVVEGGAVEGDFIANHTAVDELHLTGSIRTFEAITFGPGAQGEARKKARAPVQNRPFTCELGNISPVIIVPGAWTAGEVQDQAEQIVTWLVANAGYGCLTPRLIIQHQAWAQRRPLVDAIGAVFEQTPTRPAYYPGTEALHAAFTAAHPEARQYGRARDGHLPWTFIAGVDAGNRDDICFRREAFAGIMAETALDGDSVAGFLDAAVDFANNVLWGSLNATLIVHPAALQEPGVAAAVERAIARLRYGTVLVNMAAFAAYYIQTLPWGGFPGHEIDDIQSGVGKTANFLMLPRPQKSVLRAPFKKMFDPIRVTRPRAYTFARRLAHFEAAPSLGKMPGLLWTALGF
jgi:acyl-CoA reductase-like NAD-dependent aldehyde dehydrogenase